MRNQSYRPLALRVRLHSPSTALGGSLLPRAKKRDRAATNLLLSFTLVVAILVSSFPYAPPTMADKSEYRSASTQGSSYGAESEPMSWIASQGDTLLPANQREKLDSFGKLPLSFEPNAGQTDPAARFLVHAPGGMFFFTPSGVVLALKEPSQETASSDLVSTAPASPSISQTVSSSAPSIAPPPRVVRMNFVNANLSTAITPGELLPGKVNYLLGKDASTWRTDLPTYSSITYQALYPGIELKYDSAEGQLKGTYTVAPGADPGRIRWRYEGVDRLSVDGAGNLQAGFASTLNPGQPITVTEQAPVVWQEIAGRSVPVSAGYKVAADNSVSFALGTYDRAHPLIIDPYLTYSTYLGGNGADSSNSIAIDSAGNVYIAGSTTSTDFPISGAYQPTNGGGTDAYVTKMNATGTALLYSTYLGGRLQDHGTGIAVDAAGNAYMSGHSTSGNYPIFNQYQRQNKGQEDFVLTKLISTGVMAYSTYLGGTDRDWGNAIAVDNAGNAYLAGETQPPCSGSSCTGYTTTAFPTKNAYSTTGRGWADALVAKINTNLSGSASLVYSTYLGGTDGDGAYAIAVDSSGNPYVTGITWYRRDFPLVNPYQSEPGSGYGGDAFVTKFNASGIALVYSTYLGGTYRPYTGDGEDVGFGIAVDASGSAHITGRTNSLYFPTQNAIQPTKSTTGTDHEAFITKFNPAGNTVAYSTYLGGNGNDIGGEIAVDASGNASVAGQTASTNFRVVDAYQSTNQGSSDAFVTRLDSAGSAVLSSTYFGGSGTDSANGIAVNNLGDTYVGGTTSSANFPTTPGAYRTTGNPGDSAFIAKLTDNTPKVNECYGGGNPVIATTQPFGCGDPVNTATGNFWTSSTNIAIAGRGVPLNFTRTYNSLAANQNGPLGYGWTHSYNMYIDRDALGNYRVHQENGSVAPFRPDLSRDPRVLATLTNTNGMYLFTRMHGQIRFYFESVAGGDPNVFKLRRIVDRNGHTTVLTYTNQLLQTVADPAGRTLTFNHVNGFLNSVRDDTGDGSGPRSVVFSRDANGDLQTVADVGSTGELTHYTYEGHLLRTITDTNDGVTTNTYDGAGRLLTQSDAVGNPPLRLGYSTFVNGFSTSTRITDSVGLVSVHDYEAGRLKKLTSNPGAEQSVTTYSYKPGTNYLSSVTDPLLHTTSYTWDDTGNLLSHTDPLNHTTSYIYFSTNDLHQATNPANVTTSYSYDTNGNLTSVSTPLTQTGQTVTTSYGYDYRTLQVGDMLTMTNPLNRTWSYTYDQYGYPDTATNPAPFTNEVTNYDYDAIGRLSTLTDPKLNSTTYLYNLYNDPIRVTDPLNHTTIYTYDNVGNLTNVTDPKGHTNTSTYNLNNQVERVTQHDGTYSEYRYDGVGRVLTQTNALGKQTTYRYEDNIRRVTVTDPLTRQTKYNYDKAGRLSTTIDAHQPPRTTTYGYYDDDQLQSIDYSDPSTPDVTYTYYNTGLRESMIDGTGTTSYGYDSLNRLTSVQDSAGRVMTYTLDLADNITGIRYPDVRLGEARTSVRTYDETNRLKRVYNFASGYTEYDYDRNSNLTGITPRQTLNGNATTIGYDAVNQVISITIRDGFNPPILDISYTRDELGLVDRSAEQIGSGTNVFTATHKYEYDTLDRLIGDFQYECNGSVCRSPISSTWSYDAASQLSQTLSLPILDGDVVTTTREYDHGGQITSFVEVTSTTSTTGTTITRVTRDSTFAYSATGSRIREVDVSNGRTLTTTYGYDQADHLINYTNPLDVRDHTTYRYNGEDLRTTKRNDFSLSHPITYTWDLLGGGVAGMPLLARENHVQGSAPNTYPTMYLYGPGGMLASQQRYSASVPGSPGSPGSTGTPSDAGEPNKREGQARPDDEYFIGYYYHTDGQGNIRAVSENAMLGQIQASYAYDAYGKQSCTWQPDCSGVANPFGFAGQYTDQESGLLYMRGRYYDPSTQQFLSRDPLEATTGQPYTYAWGNPTNFVDPTGSIGSPTSWLFQAGGGKDKYPPGPVIGGGAAGAGGRAAPSGAGVGTAQAREAASKVLRVPPSAGRKAREQAGQNALEEVYGPGRKNVKFETQHGKRIPDLVVERNGKIYAHESCVATGCVRASTHKLGQALKDFELMQSQRGYTPIWHFWDGPPAPDLGATLRAFGIKYKVYNP